MIVYLNDRIHPAAEALLRSQVEVVDNFDHIEQIDAILSRGTRVNADMMERAKKLKVIGKHGVGVELFDLEAAKRLGIQIVSTPLGNADSVAELCVGLILDAARHITLANKATLQNRYRAIAPQALSGFELGGKTLGLIGMGNIAQRVGKILNGGFGMRLLGYDPFVSAQQAAERGIEKYDSLEEMLEQADVISIHVPLTDGTRNLFSKKQLSHCKKTAILVNASRGGIVNEEDLYQALKDGTIYGAAIDTFADEPLMADNRLLSLDNCVGTPHIGACTEEAMLRMGMTVVEDILRVLKNEAPLYPYFK